MPGKGGKGAAPWRNQTKLRPRPRVGFLGNGFKTRGIRGTTSRAGGCPTATSLHENLVNEHLYVSLAALASACRELFRFWTT